MIDNILANPMNHHSSAEKAILAITKSTMYRKDLIDKEVILQFTKCTLLIVRSAVLNSRDYPRGHFLLEQ